MIILYVLIPYITRKKGLKRRKGRVARKISNFEKVDIKYEKEKLITLIDSNQKLKVNLKADLQKISSQKNLESFFSNFEKLYPNFKNSLLEKAHNLTTNEIKICAFLRLQLSSKEISTLLNIEPESVHKTRYRIRKKLQLNTKEDLASYISTF